MINPVTYFLECIRNNNIKDASQCLRDNFTDEDGKEDTEALTKFIEEDVMTTIEQAVNTEALEAVNAQEVVATTSEAATDGDATESTDIVTATTGGDNVEAVEAEA